MVIINFLDTFNYSDLRIYQCFLRYKRNTIKLAERILMQFKGMLTNNCIQAVGFLAGGNLFLFEALPYCFAFRRFVSPGKYLIPLLMTFLTEININFEKLKLQIRHKPSKSTLEYGSLISSNLSGKLPRS